MQRFPVTLAAHAQYSSADQGITLHRAEMTQAEYDQLQVDKGLAILVTPSGTEFKGRVASEPTERKPGYFDALFHTVDPT